MSSMLRESIVDAKALRASALKNAESVVIQKYSEEVKNTLEKLLEQEEEPALDLDAPPEIDAAIEPAMFEEEPAEEVEEVVQDQTDIPFTATNGMSQHDGQNLKDLPGSSDNVEVTIDLGALQEALTEINEELDNNVEIEFSAEELSEVFDDEDEQETDRKAADARKTPWFDRTDKQHAASTAKHKKDNPGGIPRGSDYDPETEKPKRYKGSSDRMRSRLEEDEEAIEAMVDGIMEKLTADMGPELSGWAGRPASQLEYEQEKALAAEAADEPDSLEEEEEEDEKQNLQESDTVSEKLTEENSELKRELEKYQSVLAEVKENLFEVNLSNARLLYTNRVLRNTSLNERQKDKIVEAISNAGSVSEAKTIFETLQSTVEASTRHSPKSLSEALGRRSSVLTASRKETKTSQDPFSDRMRRLAGIK
jgi:hypothetical protein